MASGTGSGGPADRGDSGGVGVFWDLLFCSGSQPVRRPGSDSPGCIRQLVLLAEHTGPGGAADADGTVHSVTGALGPGRDWQRRRLGGWRIDRHHGWAALRLGASVAG